MKSNTKVLVRHLSGEEHEWASQWKDYTEDLELFVQQFPKIELHVHLDGSFDPHVLWNHLQETKPESLEKLPSATPLPWKNNEPLPVQQLVQQCQTARDYHALCTCRDRGERSLEQMLTCFEIFLPTVRENLELIEQLAYDFCQRQWQQHCIYTEVRYSPHLLAEGFTKDNDTDHNTNPSQTVTGEQVYQVVTRGLRKGCQQFGITINQILCCINWRPDWAQPTLDLVQQYQNDFPCAAVGIDIAAGEEHFDKENFPNLHEPHFQVIQQAKDKNIPITLHAGEVPIAEKGLDNLRRAVHEYGAVRIGHGYRIASSPETMKELREQNIHFEICPTSSVETGGWAYNHEATTTTTGDEQDTTNNNTADKNNKDWTQHPGRIMQKHGLSISLNSDDPAVFHTSLAWQFRMALAKMKMSRFELYKANIDAVQASFCDEATKEQMTQQIRHYGQSTGVIDVHGNMVEHLGGEMGFSASSSDQDTSSTTMGERSRPYRRSLSENFQDRVYLETKRSADLVRLASDSSDGDDQQDVNDAPVYYT